MKSVSQMASSLQGRAAATGSRSPGETPEQQLDGFRQVGESDIIGHSGFMVVGEVDGWIMAARMRKQDGRMIVDEIRLRPADGFPQWHLSSDDEGEGREARERLDSVFWGPYQTARKRRPQVEEPKEDQERVLDSIDRDDDDGHTIPGNGVTTTLINSLPWGRLFDLCREQAYQSARANEALQEWTDYQLPDIASVQPALRRPGRGGRSDLELARVAQNYVALWDSDKPAPIDTIAKQEQYARSTVAGWIKQARDRGLLTRPPSRRGGGELTSKAEALLQMEGDKNACS